MNKNGLFIMMLLISVMKIPRLIKKRFTFFHKSTITDAVMNTILIIYDISIESDILVTRIKSLGDNYVFWENHWLVKTEMTAKEAYERIATNGYEGKSMIVIRIDNRDEIGYWGVMNRNLWEWFKQGLKEKNLTLLV